MRCDPRCRRCDDVIGVYEPTVLLTVHGPRVTSRAAEPGLHGDEASLYHLSCYELDSPGLESGVGRTTAA